MNKECHADAFGPIGPVAPPVGELCEERLRVHGHERMGQRAGPLEGDLTLKDVVNSVADDFGDRSMEEQFGY